MPFPALPIYGEKPWYTKRAAFDAYTKETVEQLEIDVPATQAAITDLETGAAAMESAIATNDSDINGLSTSLSDTQTTVAGLSTAVSDLEAEVGALTGTISVFPDGHDVSGLPDGSIYGFYTPSAPPVVAPDIVAKFTQATGSAVTSITVNPASPTTGVAAVDGDMLIVCIGVNAPDGTNTTPSLAGWTLMNTYNFIGTMKTYVFAHRYTTGDTTYTFTIPGTARYLNLAAVTLRGATSTLASWVKGPEKHRAEGTAESVTCTAGGVAVSTVPSLELAISFERTSATEATAPTVSGATLAVYAAQSGSAITTIMIAEQDVTAAGTTSAATFTYPNTQSTNGWAYQLVIPHA